MGRFRQKNPNSKAVCCPSCGWRTTIIPAPCKRTWRDEHPEGCPCLYGSCHKKNCGGALMITQDEYTWAREKREEESKMGEAVQIIGKGDSVFETNITRSEAIDIVIEELRGTLEAEVEKAEKVHEAAKLTQKAVTTEAGKALLASHLKDATFKLGYGQSHIEINVGHISKRNFPAKLKAAIVNYDRTKADLIEARRRLGKFNAAATRNRIRVLRASLESSSEGRTFLKKVDTLKTTISRQLLAAAA